MRFVRTISDTTLDPAWITLDPPRITLYPARITLDPGRGLKLNSEFAPKSGFGRNVDVKSLWPGVSH